MAGWKKSDIISALSATIAILVFGFGIWQYRSSENWKRSEFVAKKISDFNSDRIHRSIIQIIEYDDAMVEIFPGKPAVKVRSDLLIKAIEEKGEPTDVEFQVQQYFDYFLKSLARFNYFL